MTKTSQRFNPNVLGMSILGVFSVASLGALALESKTTAPQYEVRIAPVDASVQSIQLDSETTGIAVIKMDEFRIQVSFDFEAHPDDFGVMASSFTAVEITNLAVDQITDVLGNHYSDFTDRNDHRNINLLLTGFIEKNKLVGA